MCCFYGHSKSSEWSSDLKLDFEPGERKFWFNKMQLVSWVIIAAKSSTNLLFLFSLGVQLRSHRPLTEQSWRDRPAGLAEKPDVRSDRSQKTSLSPVLTSTLRRRHENAKGTIQLNFF